MAVRVGERNLFGMRATAVRGGSVDLICETCGETGSVPASEFQSTRCGSARCGASQGRTE